MSSGTTRHRLTISISTELFEVVREVAGSRKISAWLEEAAWRRLRADLDRDLVGIGELIDTEQDLTDLGASPQWSNLAR